MHAFTTQLMKFGYKLTHPAFNLVYTLPETNSSPLKMDGWAFGAFRPIFKGKLAVSFREGNWDCNCESHLIYYLDVPGI